MSARLVAAMPLGTSTPDPLAPGHEVRMRFERSVSRTELQEAEVAVPATGTPAEQGVDEEEPAPDGEADAPASAPRAPAPRAPSVGGNFTLAEVEREHVVRVLARAPTLREASRILGIDATTLWRKRKTWSR